MPIPHRNVKEPDAADTRLRRNRHNPTSRFLAPDGDKKAQEDAGIKGEQAVAKYLCLDPTPITGKKKRKGYNLTGPAGEKINAITARKQPNWLPVEVGHTEADIYVLCFFDGKQQTARLVGWATRDEILAAPPRQLISGGPKDHAIYVTVLRPMADLKRMMVPSTMSLFSSD